MLLVYTGHYPSKDWEARGQGTVRGRVRRVCREGGIVGHDAFDAPTGAQRRGGAFYRHSALAEQYSRRAGH